MTTLRERVWQILRPAGYGDRASHAADLFLIGLVLIDLACFIIDSVVDPSRAGRSLRWIEDLILVVFLVDYVLRLWACKVDERYDRPFGRLRYAITPFAIVDLLAALPAIAWMPGIASLVPVEPQLALVRILRVFRIGKLARYSRGVHTLGRALERVRMELGAILVSVLVLVLLASTLTYAFEQPTNPKFSSIPQAMWWAVVTMTTVGYGDMAPITPAGRFIATGLMIAGIGLFALPAGLLGAAFTEEVRLERKRLQQLRTERRDRAERLREEQRLEASAASGEGGGPSPGPSPGPFGAPASAGHFPCPHCGRDVHVPGPEVSP